MEQLESPFGSIFLMKVAAAGISINFVTQLLCISIIPTVFDLN